MMLIVLRKLSAVTSSVLLLVCLGQTRADTISIAIAGPLDDVEQSLDDTSVFDQPSTDLELGTESPPDGPRQAVGLRFLDIGIPAGSTISNARIQFMVDEADDEATSVRIFGEMAANSEPFMLTDSNVSGRPRTSASVLWSDIPAWKHEGDMGPEQLTPDLSEVIQEIIDQPDWTDGNAISLVILPDPIDSNSGERTAISLDKAMGHKDKGWVPPTLKVDFVVPEPSSALLIVLSLAAMLSLRRR